MSRLDEIKVRDAEDVNLYAPLRSRWVWAQDDRYWLIEQVERLQACLTGWLNGDLAQTDLTDGILTALEADDDT